MQATSKTLSVAAKAATLWLDGYLLTATIYRGVYTVLSPEGNFYRVDLNRGTCTCKGGAHRDCKHRCSLRWLALKGSAPGLDAETIAACYDPSLEVAK